MSQSGCENRGQDSFSARSKSSLLPVCLCLVLGCQPAASQPTSGGCELSFAPAPPVVGPAAVTVKLYASDGQPLRGAQVALEGNMNHAGMKPSFADLTEAEPGEYRGVLEFTMGGDWFVLVNATLPDGTRRQHQKEVLGVAAP